MSEYFFCFKCGTHKKIELKSIYTGNNPMCISCKKKAESNAAKSEDTRFKIRNKIQKTRGIEHLLEHKR